MVAGIPGDEATVKRFFPQGSRIVLKPENSTMEPMDFDSSEVVIFGRVISVFVTTKPSQRSSASHRSQSRTVLERTLELRQRDELVASMRQQRIARTEIRRGNPEFLKRRHVRPTRLAVWRASGAPPVREALIRK